MKYASFFSRLYETAEAFRNVTEDIRHGGHSAKETEYQIVEECLDVLNQLYIPDETIEILTIRLDDLDHSQYTNPLDKRLCDLILEDAATLPLNASDREISLILRHGHVIGGISPFTHVYSKPDSHRDRGLDMWNLSNRPYSFIRYLYSLAVNGQLQEILRDYIFASLYGHQELMKRLQDDIQDLCSLVRVKDRNGVEVMTNGYYVYRYSADDVVAGSGYLLKSPKLPLSGSERIPLVLSQSGIPDAPYVWDHYWNPLHMSGGYKGPVNDRILPGVNLRYPYLTVCDFLTENIIECSSSYDSISQRYLYRVSGGRYVMLPLREIFFDYFTIEDLYRLLSIDYIDDCYHVHLDIPVQAGTIQFHKMYDQDSIVVLNLDSEFNMAISPFLVTEELPRHIVAFQDRCECRMRFFNSEHNIAVNSNSERSEWNFNHRNGKLDFVKTEQLWDYMSLTVRKNDSEGEGILIPRFSGLVEGDHDEYVYSVIISDRYVRVMQFNRMKGYSEPLVLGRNSEPVRAMADTPMFDSILRQCFIWMGEDEESHLSLEHIPLAVNVARRFDHAEMLGGCNIAFNLCDSVPYDWRQTENLFFANPAVDYLQEEERVFCQEIAYLIKLSRIEKGMDNSPEIRVEVPLWMTDNERMEYRTTWESAFSAVGMNPAYIEFIDCHAQPSKYIEDIHFTHGEAIHVDIDAYHTVLFRFGNNMNVIDYKIFDFGINNLYGIVNPFHSSHDNAYIRWIVGLGQRDPKLMMMLDQHQSFLDILEYAIEIKDRSCLDIPEFMLPYALFIRAVADAIVDFAESSGSWHSIDVILSGEGLMFLSELSRDPNPGESIGNLIIAKGIHDVKTVNVYVADLPKDCAGMNIRDYPVPRMSEFQNSEVQSKRLTPNEVYDIIKESGIRILSDISKMIDGDWMSGILRKFGITSKESLLRIIESSYEQCVRDYTHNREMDIYDRIIVPDTRFWPYFYSLPQIALDVYTRQLS